MSDYHFKDLADEILLDFEAEAENLCKKNIEESGLNGFTSQQLLKRVIQKHQDTYIEWLVRARPHFPGFIFNKVHEDLGRMISVYANRHGYQKRAEGRTETNIFDDPTDRVVYYKE